MSIPSVNLTVGDGELGLVVVSPRTQCKVGVCSAGTTNLVQAFGNKDAVRSALGYGPLAEAAIATLDVAGGPIVCVPVNPAVAGKTVGQQAAVVHTGTGTSTMTITGSPLGSYTILVTVATAVALVSTGTGAITYSLDNGSTTSSSTLVPASGMLVLPGTGLTLNFTTAFSLVLADTYASATSQVTAHTGTGSSIATVTTTAANDDAQVQIQIVTAAASLAAFAQLIYSLDNGVTWSSTYSLATSGIFPIPNTGITVTFAAGTFVAGDLYSFLAIAPGYTTSDMVAAVNAAIASPQGFFAIHAVGVPSLGGQGAELTPTSAVYGALEGALESAATSYRFVRGIMEMPTATDAKIIAQFTATGTRTMVCADFCTVLSTSTGSQKKRPSAWVVSARLSAIAPSVSVGAMNLSGSGSGSIQALSNVQSIGRDEFKTPALDAINITTLRTWPGIPGFFVTNGRIKASNTSDFQYMENARVMDVGSATAYAFMLPYVNSKVRVNATTGTILEKAARTIEARGTRMLYDAVVAPGDASDVQVTVDRTIDILSTRMLSMKFRIIPVGYGSAVNGDIAFLNPALTLAAA